jgi:hypothetical protein
MHPNLADCFFKLYSRVPIIRGVWEINLEGYRKPQEKQ